MQKFGNFWKTKNNEIAKTNTGEQLKQESDVKSVDDIPQTRKKTHDDMNGCTEKLCPKRNTEKNLIQNHNTKIQSKKLLLTYLVDKKLALIKDWKLLNT